MFEISDKITFVLLKIFHLLGKIAILCLKKVPGNRPYQQWSNPMNIEVISRWKIAVHGPWFVYFRGDDSGSVI